MTMLEDALRETFSARVDSTPSVDDPAGRAIRRGRSIRRRLATTSALATAMAFVLVVGGVSALGGCGKPVGRLTAPAGPFEADPPPGDPSPAVQPTASPSVTGVPGVGLVAGLGAGLDLRVGNQLRTGDGRQLALTGVGEVTRIYRVPTGWVYGGRGEVRLLRPDGTSIPLSRDGDRWVLSPDGERLAVGAGTVLRVATLGPSGLSTPVSTAVPAGTRPVAFVGDRVVVSAPPGQPTGFDLVEPGKSRPPKWSTGISAIYGLHDKRLVGLVPAAPGGKTCLAEIEVLPGGLAAAGAGACPLVLPPPTGDGRLSPDGGWLAQPSDADVLLVDVASVLAGKATVVNCGARSPAAPVWVDSRTVLAADEQGVVRCGTDGSRQGGAPPAGAGEEWQFVPGLPAQSTVSATPTPSTTFR